MSDQVTYKARCPHGRAGQWTSIRDGKPTQHVDRFGTHSIEYTTRVTVDCCPCPREDE